jgi:hypothetical protein
MLKLAAFVIACFLILAFISNFKPIVTSFLSCVRNIHAYCTKLKSAKRPWFCVCAMSGFAIFLLKLSVIFLPSSHILPSRNTNYPLSSSFLSCPATSCHPPVSFRCNATLSFRAAFSISSKDIVCISLFPKYRNGRIEDFQTGI